MGSSLEKEAKNVNKMADKKFKEKDYVEAIKLYQESISLMKKAGNLKEAEKYRKELDEAVAKRAAEINAQGDELFKKKEYKEAMQVYRDALSLLKKAGDKWEDKYGKEFLKELNKCKIKYVKDVLIEQAEKLAKEDKVDEAAKLYEEMLDIISPNVDKKLNEDLKEDVNKLYERWAEEINEEGDKLYKDDKFEDAIEAYSRAVRLIKKSGNEKKLKNYEKELGKAFKDHAEEINKVGDRLFKEKKYKEASDLYAESVRIAKSAGDQKLVSNFTKEMEKAFEKLAQEINSEGDQLFKGKKYEEAAKVYKRSLEIAKEYKQEKLISSFTKEYEKALENWAAEVNEQGDAKRKAKDWEAAIKYYDKSVEIIEKTENQGRIKDYTKEYQETCKTLAKEINSDADDLYKANQYKKAYELYNKSVKLAEAAGDEKLVRNYMKERNKCLAKMD